MKKIKFWNVAFLFLVFITVASVFFFIGQDSLLPEQRLEHTGYKLKIGDSEMTCVINIDWTDYCYSNDQSVQIRDEEVKIY